MLLHSSTYPNLALVLPPGDRVQFEDGYAEVDDDRGALALELGADVGVVESPRDATGVPVVSADPTGEAATFGRRPADTRLPSSASTDVGGPGTAPGETALVGDRPTAPQVGGAAPAAGPAAGDDEIPSPLPEKLTDLSLEQLKLLAVRHDVDASSERAKKGVIALLPDRAVLDAWTPGAVPEPDGSASTDVGGPGTAPGETEQPNG